ncbi:MAG TPA: phosphoribosylanthranilate isomerase [Chthoniobacterales bacterium]|nr:phosphoribosylanthranilate isomerase [Chthoniobacterales bacterium]
MKAVRMFGSESTARSRIFVKICGITNEPDALAAIEAGADALGFNFVRHSKRYVDIDAAATWIAKLPKDICKVAVLADPNWEDACRISQLRFIDALQLHGNESPDFCRRLTEAGIRFAKALPVADSKSLNQVPEFFTDTLILDKASGAGFGGTGKAFSWKSARQFIQTRPERQVIVAGGLNPDNVAQAIAEAQPGGVDVTTGVEASPGRKDHRLVKAFIHAARPASRASA